MRAGTLKHRVTFQKLNSNAYDPVTGDEVIEWVDVVTVWAKVEPLSAREFIQSQAEQSQVIARITIRHREGLSAEMRIKYRNELYDILGLLEDKSSGLEYITIPVSRHMSQTGE